MPFEPIQNTLQDMENKFPQDHTGGGAAAKVAVAVIIGLAVGFAAGAFWQESRLSGDASDAEKREEARKEEGREETAATDEGRQEISPTEGATRDAVQSAAAAATATAAATAREYVSVSNQMAGSKVLVNRVAAAAPTWVGVREESEGGFGNILGAQRVLAGENRDVIVELLRPTVPNATYFVVLYRDTGSPAFNYREEVLLAGSEQRFQTEQDAARSEENGANGEEDGRAI